MKTLIEQHATRLDVLPLDCENLIRVVATLLSHDGTPYKAHRGSLWVKGVGHLEPHCWIVLESGEVVDFRARFWLGNDAKIPHGVFIPAESQIYTSHSTFSAALHDVVFFALTGIRFEHFPSLATPPTGIDQIGTRA